MINVQDKSSIKKHWRLFVHRLHERTNSVNLIILDNSICDRKEVNWQLALKHGKSLIWFIKYEQFPVKVHLILDKNAISQSTKNENLLRVNLNSCSECYIKTLFRLIKKKFFLTNQQIWQSDTCPDILNDIIFLYFFQHLCFTSWAKKTIDAWRKRIVATRGSSLAEFHFLNWFPLIFSNIVPLTKFGSDFIICSPS